MMFKLLFGMLFASQIVLVSPPFARHMARHGVSTPVLPARLTTLDIASLLIGLAVLGLGLVADFATMLTPVLLAIGLYFFFQLLVLALSGALRVKTTGPDRAGPVSDATGKAPRLSEFVPPLLTGVAIILFLAQSGILLSQWAGGWDTDLLKMTIYFGANLFFAALITRELRAVHKDAMPEQQHRLARTLPILVLISIGISVYFAKQVLFELDLPALRPAMMSAFLQLLAITAAFGGQVRTRNTTRTEPPRNVVPGQPAKP